MSAKMLLNAAVGVLALSSSALASPYGIKVGVLNCAVDDGWGYVIGSSKDVRCAYRPNHGTADYYVGSISKFGVDLGYTSGGAMVWDVVAPTSDLRQGALAGDYAGGTASATLAAGVGVNVLLGGFDKSIALQPVSFESNSGLDIAAGIGALSLKVAPPPPLPPVAVKEIKTETFAVGFAFNSTMLPPAARAMIREAALEARRAHPDRILVVGHADRVGTARYNDELSLMRADVVRDELIRNGVDVSLIDVSGDGFLDPSVPTAQGVREPQNRCAVIELRNVKDQWQAAR